MKIIKAVWYTGKSFPNWFKYEFVKNYKMTDEEREEEVLAYFRAKAVYDDEVEYVAMKDSGIVKEDDNEPPF